MPFSSPTSVDEPQTQSNPISRAAMFNSAIRAFLWIIFFIGGFVFVIPVFGDMFEDFGLELPALTKLLLALSYKSLQLVFVFAPMVLILFPGIEVVYLVGTRGTCRFWINLFLWCGLIGACLFVFVGLAIPTYELSIGLTEQ